MNGRTLSILIVALIAGILIGRLPFVGPLYASLPFLFASGCFLISILLSRKQRFGNHNWLNDLSASALFLGVGIFGCTLSKPSTTIFSKGEYSFSGSVSDYCPMSYGDKLLIDLEDLNLIVNDSVIPVNPRNLKAYIFMTDATTISYGSRISGYADLEPVDCPSNYRNDDYVDYLHQKGIYLRGFTDAAKCSITPHGSFSSFFRNLRDDMEAGIESTTLSTAAKSFLISFLLGDKTYINNDDRLTFTDAGVAHIFAVSGLHVSLVSLLIISLLSPFFFGKTRFWKYIIALPIVWLYIVLVGFSPSTLRAGIMLSLAFIAFSMERRHDALKSLGWSVLLILAFLPSALFDIGFQLSVLCVGSLILIAGPLNFMDHRSHSILFRVVSVILVTLTATFSSWLVCAFYFHRFSLMFLPLNLIAVPLIPVFISLSLIYLLFFYFGIDITFIGRIIDSAYYFFSKGASFITSFSTSFENIHPHFSTVALWIIGLISLAWLLCKSKARLKKLWVPCLFFITAFVSLFVIPVSLPEGFILQKNSDLPQIISYSHGKETKLSIPEGDAVEVEINGKKLLALKKAGLSEPLCNRIRSADIVLLCKGCKDLPSGLEELLAPDCMIVTHPSLHWRHERKIIQSAHEKNMTLHSLRYDGPLHVFED